MKKVLLILSLLFLYNSIYAQKLYVWKPKTQQVSQRPFYQESDTIDIVIYDGRTFNKKCKIECSSEELVNEFNSVFKQAYGKATLNFCQASAYNKKAQQNHITIKVGIAGYYASFGSDIQMAIGSVGGSFSVGAMPKGEWNAITALYVRVYDKRDGNDIKNQKEISYIESKSNMWGYASARSALNATYLKAITEMLLVIDNTIMED